jgi:hypothetical protein
MAYTDFTLETIEEKFGIKNREVRLFGALSSIEPSAKLKDDLEEANTFPLRTEKAKSELLVMPVLKELRRRNSRYFTIYSGEVLNADSVNGLNGECDFILAKDIGSYSINYPIIQLVEAKKNDIDLGIPQCAAQMVGAKVFNQKKGVETEKIYGCVTTGDEWLFMKLEKDIEIDTQTYYLNQLPEILGVFQHIIEYYKATLK